MSDVEKQAGPEQKNRPVVLLLLGGWGIATAGETNAISQAKTPVFSNLISEYPVAILEANASSLNARYLTIGAGREISDESASVENTLTSTVAAAGLRQVKIAETERFAALTHFFNGGREDKARGEEWNIVSSEYRGHASKPHLVLKRTVKEIIKEIDTAAPRDLIVAVTPYLDLAAKSEDPIVIKKAIEDIDKSLRQIVTAVEKQGGVLIISAAAGNVERIRNLATELNDSEMTDNPVPLIIIGSDLKGKTIGLADPLNSDLSSLAPAGTLADLAPTVLHFLGLEAPSDMTGKSLLS